MEHLRSEPFQLGSGIGRSHHNNGINPAASYEHDSRDDAADRSGRGSDCAADPTQFQKPPPSTSTNMAAVSKRFHQLVVKNSNAYGDHGHISRTISQDTAETAALSIASELTAGTAGTAGTSHTAGTDATLDAAIATSREGGHAHALLELSTIEEDSAAGTGTGGGGASTAKGITDTPGGKSNAATAGVDAEAAEKATTNHGDRAMKMDISADVRTSFPSFLSTLPPTWSGTSLSFIKFLLFVKESDEAFIPEMDRMLADYDRLVAGLQHENAALRTQLQTEIGTLKKRVHDKKRLVQKLTKKLTECQGYITELTDELERIYRENRGTVVPSSRAASLAAARPAADDITVTSEITMEHSLHQGGGGGTGNHLSSGVEATLSRMLAEERSRAETLAELNRSVQDDLADARGEVDELERKLAQSDRSRRAVEATVQGQWHKVRSLIEENKTLHEDVAGVVIELSDAKEEFTEREAQLIAMIEEGGEKVRALIADNKALHEDLAGVVIELSDAQEEFAEREAQLIDMIESGGGAAAEYGEEEDDCNMEVDGANVHDLEANIAVLQEELEVSRRVMESIKHREKESSHKAGELLIRNETLRTKQAVMEEMHQKEAFGMRREIDRLRRENGDMRKAMQQNRSSQYMFSN